jgi:N-acetylated-alpha-linked acidic dipeptidase
MLEVIAIFGQLRAQGWRPLRSIIFASWDAEEYNMIGSTEWVEDHIDDLRRSAVAYLNVDVGVSGPNFEASASPLFHRALTRVLDRVADPNTNKTIQEIWDSHGAQLGGLGSGSDYVAFQDLAGTSSIDFGFQGDGFPYHSCYETFEWMSRFGDPTFSYHAALAQIWALLILELSQNLLLPLSPLNYASSLDEHVKVLRDYAQTSGAPINHGFDVTPLADAVQAVQRAAQVREEWEMWWFGQVYGSGAVETNALADVRRDHNNKISDFDTNLLDIQGHDPEHPRGEKYGIPGREQFKHVIFGPQRWSGYDEAWFPFVRDAIEDKDWARAQKMVDKTARIITRAAEQLMDN